MAAKDKDKEAALPEGQAEKPRKKSRLKRIVIILAILLMTLGGAGIGAYWWLFLRTPVEEVPAVAAEAGAEAPQGAPGKAPAPGPPRRGNPRRARASNGKAIYRAAPAWCCPCPR